MNIFVTACVSDRSERALYYALARSGHSIEMICDPREPEQAQLAQSGISVIPLEIRSRLDFAVVRTIRRRLRAKPFDVIYAPTSRGLSTAIMASRGMSIAIVAYRGTMGHLSRFDPGSRLSHLNSRVSALIANSNAVKNYLRSVGIPDQKLFRVYKGHDPAWYENYPAARRADIGIPDDAFVVGCVANFRPVKGIDILVRAARELDSALNVHFVLVGDNRDTRIQKLISKFSLQHRFHLVGYQEEVIPFIRACNVTVMPSVEREGMPRAVIESLLVQVPVIVTDVGGVPELVQDEKSGFIVAPRNAQQLSSAIAHCVDLGPQLQEFGVRGKDDIRQRFHVTDYVENMLSVFQQAQEQLTSRQSVRISAH